MANFIPYNHNQNAMVVVNFQDKIQPGMVEHALHYLIEHKFDLSICRSLIPNTPTTSAVVQP